MAVIIHSPSFARALGIVDALHAIVGCGMKEDEVPVNPGDTDFLRPYAVVEVKQTWCKETGVMPFPTPLLMFTTFKIRECHRFAALTLRTMGVTEEIIFLESPTSDVIRRRWRGKVVVKLQLFRYAFDCGVCSCDDDDGYVRALGADGPISTGWATRRIVIRDDILSKFEERMRHAARSLFFRSCTS